MTLTVQIIAAALALAGLAGFVHGTDLLPTERGIAYTISSVVALSGAAITLALSLVVRRLDRLSEQLKARRPEIAVVPDVAAPVASPAREDQPELPLEAPSVEPVVIPVIASAAPAVESTAPDLALPAPKVEPPRVEILPEPPAPAASPAKETRRPRFKLPSFRKGAGGAAAGAAAGALVAATAAADPQPASGEGSGEGGNGTRGDGMAGDPLPAIDLPVAEDVALAQPEMPVEGADLSGSVEAPRIESGPAAGMPAPVTQRPRIDFAPPDEIHRPRKAEPPLAPPRLPKIAEPPVEALEAVPEPAAAGAQDPFAALEAEFDRLIPLKPAAPAAPPEPGPYVEADIDRPDEALMIALSDEPLLSDGMRPEPPPPAPEPGHSPLRGGLAGPIELEERELAPPGVEVIGSYESGGARYTMYSDSSVVVEIDGKTVKFSSLEQLRDYIEAGSAKE